MTRLGLFCGLALLTGCSSLPFDYFKAESVTLDADHAARVLALDRWRLAGRIGIQRGDEGFSGGLDWRNHAAAFDLRVSAPLNGGTFSLAGDATGVTMTTAAGERRHARDVEGLMSAELGWALPLDGARYWVRGVPAPHSDATQVYKDEHGRWTDFVQDGWRVSILDYREVAATSLPRKLFLSHADLEVRVIIKNWEISSP